MTAPSSEQIQQYIEGRVKFASDPDKEGWRKIHCPKSGAHSHGDRNASATININSGHIECHACGLKGLVGKIYPDLGWSAPSWNGNQSTVNSNLPAWRKIWDETIKADSEEAKPLKQYLQNRGIILPKIPEDIRFHRQLAYYADKGTANEKIGDYPAMVLLVRNKDGRPTGIQRIYLTTDGNKAPVEKPKKALGFLQAGAVYFGQQNGSGSLNAAEGPETALAVFAVSGFPTCSTISATGMRSLSIPAGVQTIDIWVDKDRSDAGTKAALKLAQRAHKAGLTVYFRLPPFPIPDGAKGIDWLDVLQQHGPEALTREIERGEPWNPESKFMIGHAAKALQPQPEISWLFRDFLARRWVSIWFGEPGCKKTWAICDQAVCLAMGKSWLGFQTYRSTVLIVDEESGDSRLLRRLGDAMRGHGAPADIPLYYVSLHGFNLTSDAGAAEFDDLVKEVKPQLVLIDAMADLMLGGDENLVKDTQPILVRLRRTAERHDCGIEVIHHVNKGGSYRGSTALKGAVDTMLLIESRPDDSLVTFTAEKTRDVIIKPFAASAHFDIGTFKLIEADPPTGQLKLSPGEKYVLKYLEQNGPATVKAIMENADACSPETARRAVYSLADRDKIHRIGEGGRGKNHEATYEIVRNN